MEEYDVDSTSRMSPGECKILKKPTKISPDKVDKMFTCIT
jgi:hypothetical protein